MREVAIACHFEPLVALRQAHIGFFWSKIRDQFPEVEDHEPRPPYVESLEDDTPRPAFELEILSAPMPNRAWFVASDKTELLQLQRDRFVHNWRHQNDGYPHFEPLLANFVDGFTTLRTTLQELGLPSPRLNHAEVTYVNRIEASALDQFLTFVTCPDLSAGGVMPNEAFGQLGLRFPVRSDDKTVGHLYTECLPAPAAGDEGPGYQMTLTFRAPMPEPRFDDLQDLLLQGRSAIVHTFAGITQSRYHEQWGRIQ